MAVNPNLGTHWLYPVLSLWDTPTTLTERYYAPYFSLFSSDLKYSISLPHLDATRKFEAFLLSGSSLLEEISICHWVKLLLINLNSHWRLLIEAKSYYLVNCYCFIFFLSYTSAAGQYHRLGMAGGTLRVA